MGDKKEQERLIDIMLQNQLDFMNEMRRQYEDGELTFMEYKGVLNKATAAPRIPTPCAPLNIPIDDFMIKEETK